MNSLFYNREEFHYPNYSNSNHAMKMNLSKRIREDVGCAEETETVIQNMVKRMRVDDCPNSHCHSKLPPSQLNHFYSTTPASRSSITQQHHASHPSPENSNHCYPQQWDSRYNISQSQTSTGFDQKFTISHSSTPPSQFPLTPQQQRQQQFLLQQQQLTEQTLPNEDNFDETPFVSPMNKLLGSLHQQRRGNTTWKRQERVLLPTHTQLFWSGMWASCLICESKETKGHGRRKCFCS